MNMNEKKRTIKVLSIKAPFAQLIAFGYKDIENRTWKTDYRGRVYIHVPKVEAGSVYQILTKEQKDFVKMKMIKDHLYQKGQSLHEFCPKRWNNVIESRSSIIGYFDLVDCVQNHSSVWAEHGENIWNWVVENPMFYDIPRQNIKGKLGLWNMEVIDHISDDGLTILSQDFIG